MSTLPALLPPAARPFDFIAVGENSLDLFCVSPTFPAPDQKLALKQLVELPGGQAATAAVACARLGCRSRYVGALGTDRAGAVVFDALGRERIDFQVVRRADTPTRTAVILVDESTGRRTVLESRDSRLDIHDDEIAAEVFGSARVMLVDGSDPPLAIRAAREARATGTRTIVDVDRASDETIALLRHIDVVIVPASFVRDATGIADVGQGLAALWGAARTAVAIATLGAEGALAHTDAGEIHVPAVATEVRDTTGAGDAFRGGFAAAWLSVADRSPDLVELLRFAAKVASRNCRALGAQTGLPTMAEAAGPGF